MSKRPHRKRHRNAARTTATPVEVVSRYGRADTGATADVQQAARDARLALVLQLGPRLRGDIDEYLIPPTEVAGFLDDVRALDPDPSEGEEDMDDLQAWVMANPRGWIVVATGRAYLPVALSYSASCPNVEGYGYVCMIGCGDPATGHVTVKGGPHDGRCLAYVCARHAGPDGKADVDARLVEWMTAELLSMDLGPGRDGSPEVWHVDHLDPLPEHRH